MANGTFFGEISLLTGQRRNATVRAITTCDLFVLDRDDFQLLLEQVLYRYLCYWCDCSHCWRTIRFRVRRSLSRLSSSVRSPTGGPRLCARTLRRRVWHPPLQPPNRPAVWSHYELLRVVLTSSPGRPAKLNLQVDPVSTGRVRHAGHSPTLGRGPAPGPICQFPGVELEAGHIADVATASGTGTAPARSVGCPAT